jgi:branched-chain amino acid transport system substrate-binding protein
LVTSLAFTPPARASEPPKRRNEEEVSVTLNRRNLLQSLTALALPLSTTMRAQAEDKEIRIGALIAASGPAAFIGISEKNAFDMLVDQINERGGMSGYRVKPFFYDTEGNSTLAVQQFRRLIDTDNVHVVVGPSTTGESLAIRGIANENKTPLISCAGAESVVTPPNPYVFKTPPTDRIVAGHLLSFMKARGIVSFGLLSSGDGFGQAGAGVVQEVAVQMGLKVAAEEFGPRDTDMTPQLLKIRASGADALLIWSVNPGPTIILKNAAAIGFNKPIYNSYGAASPQLIEQAGTAAEKSYVSSMRLLAPQSLAADDPMRPIVTKLAADYKARFNADATTFIGHPADALRLIEEALKKSGGAPDREKLAEAINGGISFPGANGMFRFTSSNHNGLDENSESMVMLQVQGGKFVVVK